MNVEALKKVIRQLIKEEIGKQLINEAFKNQIKSQMKEVMAEMLLEMAVTSGSPLNESGNKSKARMLRESSVSTSPSEFDEYPDLGATKARLAEMMGYGDMAQRGGKSGVITVDSLVTEAGVEIPAPPVPDELIEVFNRDYTDLMKALDRKKNNG